MPQTVPDLRTGYNDDSFHGHPRLTEEGHAKADHITAAFDNFLATIQPLVPDGRYLAIVKTKLEEASLFAHKANANVSGNRHPNQKTERPYDPNQDRNRVEGNRP
jgi:hypothetical protein